MPSLMLRIVTATLLVLSAATVSRAADSFSVGQAVEVREGDTWSAASIIGHEGRKYQVHYAGADASSDEWVTTDRIRKPGGAVAPSNPLPIDQPPKLNPSLKPAANAAFDVGDQIEAKWGGLWRKAVVARKSNDWTSVEYNIHSFEWVQPWRLRKLGSTEDTQLDSSPRASAKMSTPPPDDPPAPTGGDRDAKDDDGRATPHSASDTDADGIHFSETLGPAGIPIIKAELTGHDVEPSQVIGSPAPDAIPSCTAPRMLSLNHGTTLWSVRPNLIVNPQGRAALLSYAPNSGDATVFIQRVELANEDANRTVPLAPRVLPLAISLDGNRAITRSEKYQPSDRWRLDLWDIDLEKPKPLWSFRPYDLASDGTDQVRWASYVDSAHLMTCSGGHTLTLWQISDTAVKEIYTMQGDATVHPQMSAGGKYVIVGVGGQALVCDAMTGSCVAKCSAILNGDGMVASLNTNVTRLALAGGNRLAVCDLPNDRVLLDAGLPEGVLGKSVDWIAPDLVLIDNLWIFNTVHRAMLWQYVLPVRASLRGLEDAPVACWMKDRIWFLAESGTAYSGGAGKSLLTSSNPLDPKVLTANKNLADGVCLVAPGTKVSVEVNVDCTPPERAKIVEHLTRAAEAGGLIVADNQNIKLVADTKSVDQRQVKYRGNNGGNDETVTIGNTVQSVSFVVDGATVWSINSKTVGSAPFMVWHKKDVTIAETLSEQNKPSVDWFATTGIPRMILKPAEPVGTSPFAVIAGRSRPAPPK